MAVWLNSPLRRLRIGSSSSHKRLAQRPAFRDDEHEDEGMDARDYDGGYSRDDGDAVNGAAAPVESMSDAIGLVNVGNTCFVNAILQCLAVLPGLRARLEQETKRLEAMQPTISSIVARRGGDARKAEEQLVRLQTARAMLALLETLEPAALEQEEPNQHTASAGNDGDHEQMREGCSQRLRVDGEGTASGDASLAVRRPDRETVATQLRAFLDAVRKCTDLISTNHEQQGQQDAEVCGSQRGCLLMGGWDRLTDSLCVLFLARNSCRSCWNRCTNCCFLRAMLLLQLRHLSILWKRSISAREKSFMRES